MRKNHSKIVCIKLVHLSYLQIGLYRVVQDKSDKLTSEGRGDQMKS